MEGQFFRWLGAFGVQGQARLPANLTWEAAVGLEQGLGCGWGRGSWLFFWAPVLWRPP